MEQERIINKNVIKIMDSLSEKPLYFNQISEITGIKSKNNLSKNLNILTDSNLLKKEKNKSNTFYRINYQSNLSLSILNLINYIKFQKLPFEKRKAIEETLTLLKPGLAVLFGSYAKGNFTKKSDIDLLLINSKTNHNIKEIASKFGVNINPVFLEFKDLDKNNETIKHIFKTGYPLTGYLYFYKILKEL